jgi:hypothetical protein
MQQPENWQVEVDGNIYETDFAGLTQWIAESSLLPEDKVRSGNAAWVEAKNVPQLTLYFAGKPPLVSDNAATTGENFNPGEAGNRTNTSVNQVSPANFGSAAPSTSTGFASAYHSEPEPEKTEIPPQNIPAMQPAGSAASNGAKNCVVHPDQPAQFACRQCLNLFCEDCPRTIARVKICPQCGDMCNIIGAPQAIRKTNGSRPFSNSDKFDSSPFNQEFTWADFKTAWSYPFKFPTALIAGGIISALFSFGIYLGFATVMVGGLFPGLMTVLVCGVVSVSIIYGCATKAVNQVAYGNTDETFMPDTEDFSIWNTILQPCFLGLGTCLISWGPALLVAILIFKTVSGVMGDVNKEMAGANTPKKQNILLQQDEEFAPRDAMQAEIEGNSRQSEANAIKRIQDLSKTTKAAPMSFGAAKSPEEVQSEMTGAIIGKLAGRMIPLILLLGLAALWGMFYFPTALTVAGYTESIGSTMNPLVGFDTMRRMGRNYFKAFGTYLLLLVCSIFIYFGVSIVTAPLAAMGLGNAPAQFFGNIISFYLYIVTACIFGLALYRSHEKLGFSVS